MNELNNMNTMVIFASILVIILYFFVLASFFEWTLKLFSKEDGHNVMYVSEGRLRLMRFFTMFSPFITWKENIKDKEYLISVSSNTNSDVFTKEIYWIAIVR